MSGGGHGGGPPIRVFGGIPIFIANGRSPEAALLSALQESMGGFLGGGGGGGGGLDLGALLGGSGGGFDIGALLAGAFAAAGGGGVEAELARLFAASRDGAHDKPTARAVIDGLPAASVGADEVAARAACSVCLDSYTTGEAGVCSLPCAHLFHRACLLPWLEKNNTCPVRARAAKEPRTAAAACVPSLTHPHPPHFLLARRCAATPSRRRPRRATPTSTRRAAPLRALRR